MIHATLEDLLALRDGDGGTWVTAHIEACAECAAELERLHQTAAQLRALPVRRPPRNRWPEIRARVLAEQRRRRWMSAGWASVAIAASLLLAVALGAPGSPFGAATQDQSNFGPVELAELVRESRELEGALRVYDQRGRVLNGRTAMAIAELEDRLIVIDEQLIRVRARRRLTRDDEVLNLWRNRVGLLDALVNVHATRTVNVGL